MEPPFATEWKLSIHCLNCEGGFLHPELYMQQTAFSEHIDFLVFSASGPWVHLNW